MRRGPRWILDEVDLTVRAQERWVVLGPNGSGKSTLVQVASLALWPTRGTVEVLGHRAGSVDRRALRPRIGVASAALGDALRPELSALEVVLTARHGALEPWWHRYDDSERAQSLKLLDRVGMVTHADRAIGTLSSGERQRVLLARALRADIGLLLLDEPAAGLDLGARERLLGSLATLATDPVTPPIVFVTHHVEEIPPGFTHALVLAGGQVQGCGPLDETINDGALSAAFGLAISVHRDEAGRWRATATP